MLLHIPCPQSLFCWWLHGEVFAILWQQLSAIRTPLAFAVDTEKNAMQMIKKSAVTFIDVSNGKKSY